VVGDMPVNTLVLSGHWSLDNDVLDGVAAKFGNLKQCYLDGVTDLGDAILTLLKDKTRLEVLNVRDCRNVMDGNFQMISHGCDKLRYLDVSNTMISNNSIKFFAANSGELEVLLLKGCKFLSDTGIKALVDLPKLKHLSVHHCAKVTGKAFTGFTHKHLEIFDAGFCKDVGDNSVLGILKSNPNLTKFNVSHGSVTDIATNLMGKKCKHITDLDIAFSRITSGGLRAALSRLRLQRLNLAGIKHMTDEEIATVAEYGEELRFLNLRFLEFLTDAACRSIAERCSKLEEIILFGLKHVTRGAIEDLLKACPLQVISVWRCESDRLTSPV
jgi:hypothetical protein